MVEPPQKLDVMNALERGLAPPPEAVLNFHFLEAREYLKFALELWFHAISLAEGLWTKRILGGPFLNPQTPHTLLFHWRSGQAVEGVHLL